MNNSIIFSALWVFLAFKLSAYFANRTCVLLQNDIFMQDFYL